MAIKRIVVTGDPATCGHPATGSGDCTIGNLGVTRVGGDTAGAPIVGPGATTLYINNLPASLEGDFIITHGLSPHTVPITTSQNNSTVFAGDGFAGGGLGITEDDLPDGVTLDDILGGAGDGVGFGTANVDLELLSWNAVQPNISVSQPGDPCFTPVLGNPTLANYSSRLKPSCHGPILFNFAIRNSGSDDCPEFKCKIFEVPRPGLTYILNDAVQNGAFPSSFNNTDFPNDQFPYSSPSWEFIVPGIPAGSTYSAVAELPSWRYQPARSTLGYGVANPYRRHYWLQVDSGSDVVELTEVQTAGVGAITIDAV